MTIEELYELFVGSPRISTDSRNIIKDSLFFALRGASFDGNKFAVDALRLGARYSIVDSASVVEQVDASLVERLILVDDVLRTLQALARHHRRALGIDILAITGSNGKTTTKELTLAALSAKYHIGATKGNFNNHIGVPLTLLSFDKSMQMAIVEMGASSCGEIAELCAIAEPDFGLITNVGRAHLEGFGGEEGVRRAKGELYDWLSRNDGVAFVASDSEALVDMAIERSPIEFVTYSYSLADGVESHLVGEYNRYNIAAAVAVARYFGVDEAALREAIAAYNPDNNRSQRVLTERNRLIVDCYNANPSSMQVAIDNFTSEQFDGTGGKIVILGDMLELGEWSCSEHRAIIERLLECGFAEAYLVGECFAEAYKELSSDLSRITSFGDREALLQQLREVEIDGASILIKGSRGIRLEEVVKYL